MSERKQLNSSFSTLFLNILEGLNQWIKYGRKTIEAFVNTCKNALKYLGSKLLDLLDNETFWKWSKLIPLWNTIFGSAGAIRNLIAGDFSEAIKSAGYALAGVAAVFVPLYLGVACFVAFLLSGAFNNLIGGGINFIVDCCKDESLRNANFHQIEDVVYNNIIKVTPLIAVGYCPLRCLAFLCNGNRREAKTTAKDSIIAAVSTAAAYWIVSVAQCSDLIGIIEKSASSIPNQFLQTACKWLLKYASENTGRQIVAHSLHSTNQLARDSLLKEAGFPYYEPIEIRFIECLKKPGIYIKEDIHKEYMSKNFIEFVVRCLNAGYVDIEEDSSGKSIIQLAFEGGNASALQAVLAFSPTLLEDIPLENVDVVDALLSQKDSNECISYLLTKCYRRTEGMDYGPSCCTLHGEFRMIWTNPVIHRPLEVSNVGGKRVLCIDGGGTRGLLALEILRQLEKYCNGPLAKFFDFIVGTSTGGLIALLLADKNRSVADIRELYFDLKEKVFSGRKANVSEFDKLLKHIFQNRPMGSITTSTKVIITSTVMTKNNTFERRYFTNFHEETAGTPILTVARCTSAAPGYFPAVQENGNSFMDGGLTSNNPVFAAFHHISSVNMENSTFVSVGTGLYDEPNPVQNLIVSRSVPGGLRMALAGTLGQFINVLVNQVCQTDGDVTNDARLMCENSKAYFYRLNPSISVKLELDEIDDRKLVNGIWQARVFAFNNAHLLEEIAQRLKTKGVNKKAK